MTRAGVNVVVVASPLRADLAGSPYSPADAALIADAAVADTLRAVEAVTAGGPAIVGRRSFAGLRLPGLLVRAGTPQAGPLLLAEAADLLEKFDAVLGPTTGAGWWVFGLRDPRHAGALGPVPESFAGLALAALRAGLQLAMLPTLQAVDSAADIGTVAAECPPGSGFAAAAARLAAVPAG